MEENYHFDPETTVLRRADPDDCDAIINLVEIGEDDIYNRVYSYPKILKLIETAFLAITVIDRNTGSVIGFAAFEDFPQVSQHSSSLDALLCQPALSVPSAVCGERTWSPKCNGWQTSGAPRLLRS
jgi:Domain of unknown function (DUF4821)